MRPLTNLAANFVPDQSTKFDVTVWDTPFSFLEGGLASKGMQLRVSEPLTTAAWQTYVSGWKAAAASGMEAAFTSTNANAIVTDGRAPLVQNYWGSGAPNIWGCSRSGQVSVCWSGAFVPTAQRAWLADNTTLTFACAGSGLIKIVKVSSGISTQLLSTELTEQEFLGSGFSFSTTTTFAAGDTLRIYYLQTGTEPWGGLVVKAVPGTLATDATTKNQQAADAPVLSAGLFSHETPSAGTVISFVSNVEVTHEYGSASRAQVDVPLLNTSTDRHDGHGWMLVRQNASDPGALQLFDLGISQFLLRRKRLIQIAAYTPDSSGVPSTRVPIFTGYVDDFADVQNGSARITCTGFEGRMVEQYEQAPDRISYMSRGFRMTDIVRAEDSQKGQPVYNIPAFDAWPLAWAIEELATRSGIDPSRFRRAYQVMKNDGTVGAATPSWMARQVRAYTTNGQLLRLPKPVHYGNAGIAFTETRPFDDDYLFKVEPTKDIWARARELTDRVGYRLRFDENGDAALFPTNLPAEIVNFSTTDVISGTNVEKTNTAAYGAKYLETTGTVTVRKTVDAARIDVSFPRAANLGQWTVTVKQGSTVVNTLTVAPAANTAATQFLFNSQLVNPTTNATVVTVWPPQANTTNAGYGTYTVELTSTGGNASTVRLVDCLLCYAVDPERTALPQALSTSELAFSVNAQQQADEMRNKVTIVGRRKAVVTDSDKFAEARQPTEQEFVVQNAVDAGSITDPTALNYVGYPKQSMIYDQSIADDGFARYLAQVFIYRQRSPKPGATVEAGALPMVQPGDPILVTESKFDTLTDATVYVKSVTHRYGKDRATTSMVAQPWPDYPAYEPRYDINLADFGNKPVTDVNLIYTTLSGHTVTNLNGDAIKSVLDTPSTATTPGNIVEISDLTVSANTITIPAQYPWPPMPGTFQVRQRATAATGTVKEAIGETLWNGATMRLNKNMRLPLSAVKIQPNWSITQVRADVYQKSPASTWEGPFTLGTDSTAQLPFYYKIINGYVELFVGQTPVFMPVALSNTVIRLRVSYIEASGEFRTDFAGNNPYHTFSAINFASRTVTLPWAQGDGTTRFQRTASNVDVRYKSLFPASTGTDPYTALPAGTDATGADASFSPFYDPYTSELGYLSKVNFDVLAEGVYRVSVRSAIDDTVVAYLTNAKADVGDPEKHWEYLTVGESEFYWDGVDQFGEWNTKQSELYASLVDKAFDSSGEERERVGKGFYVWNQEVRGGTYPPLAYIWMKQFSGRPIIGHGTYGKWYISIESKTDRLPGIVAVDTDTTDNTTAKYIYTHLPEPTKVRLQISEWASASAYDPMAVSGVTSGLVEANWSAPTYSTPTVSTVAGFIHNQRPIRFRFKVQDRPGKLWENNTSEVSVKLTRYVHLRSIIADQTIIDKGINYAGTNVRDRTIANRRIANDEHTNAYPDTGYRKAKSFAFADNAAGTTEWIFIPKDFKREFRYNGVEESVAFGDYLQLEEVPGWTTARDVSTQRAYMQFALMSYLFYFSAMITDRSGRTTWALNTDFVDKSKVLTNTTAVTWSDDPMYQIRRTIVCRQWTKEPGWVSGQLSKFGASAGSLFDKLLEHFWWQHDISATTIGTTPVAWSSFTLPDDRYSQWHTSTGDDQPVLPAAYFSNKRQLGQYSAGVMSSNLGASWAWSDDPAWAPSITRDLHPYFLLPPMVQPPILSVATGNQFLDALFSKFHFEYDLRKINSYMTTAGPHITVEIDGTKLENYGDAAHAEVFSSAVWDMRETASNKRRFWLATRVDKEQNPCKDLGVSAYNVDYIRQDEIVHWENLRGSYSRGKYPAGGMIKVSPDTPYYLNTFRYAGIATRDSAKNPGYPAMYAMPAVSPSKANGLGIEAFRTAFRSEYVWESGAFFPCTATGAERLDAGMWWRTRFLSMASVGQLYYDFGAWTGWKDDVLTGSSVFGGRMKAYTAGMVSDSFTPFAGEWMPIAACSVLPTTTELVAHMVLVPERRGV